MRQTESVLRIGLTGGIGAGKSTVAQRFVRYGAVLVDSDVLAREVVAPGSEGLAAVVDAFGREVLTAEGHLDRAALAQRAFVTDASRQQLNRIIHPLVGRRAAELIAAAPADAVVVQDIPLLVENGLAPAMHLVIVVFATEDTRMRRLRRRGMTTDDARARMRAQASDAQRRAVADVAIDNDGDRKTLAPVLNQLWHQRLVPFEHNLRTRTPAPRTAGVPVDPNPQWPAQAQRLMARLALVCGERAQRIDHVGAAAAGLPAEDVLDIVITVANIAVADALRGPLESAGFPRATEGSPIAEGQRMHCNADPGRPVNLFVRAGSSAHLKCFCHDTVCDDVACGVNSHVSTE